MQNWCTSAMWQWTGLSLHLGPLAFDWKRLSYSPLSVLCFPQTYFKPWGREAVKLDGIRIYAYVYARIKLQSSGMPWCRWRQQWFFHESMITCLGERKWKSQRNLENCVKLDVVTVCICLGNMMKMFVFAENILKQSIIFYQAEAPIVNGIL